MNFLSKSNFSKDRRAEEKLVDLRIRSWQQKRYKKSIVAIGTLTDSWTMLLAQFLVNQKTNNMQKRYIKKMPASASIRNNNGVCTASVTRMTNVA